MNRMTRLVMLPLLFASLGVSAVVALGEPVAADPFAAFPPALQAPAAELPAEAAALPATRAVEAARMRWRLTLPAAHRSRCCRAPV